MKTSDVINQRVHCQVINNFKFDKIEEVVGWMGAIQAQDYASAKYVIGTRMKEATDASIEQAINEGKIVRTWANRGTLHFLAASDIHWMLDLLGPAILKNTNSRFKKLELTDAVLLKTSKLLTEMMRGGKHVKREEIFEALEEIGIDTSEHRGLHILYHAALNKQICIGRLEGKQVTYTLLEEWIPETDKLDRPEALGELATRYFQSHGPATLQDFAWWTGLSVADAKAGLHGAVSRLSKAVINDLEYWMAPGIEPKPVKGSTILLPAFDEYVLGYKDRDLIMDAKYKSQVFSANGIFYPTIIIDGRVAGTWKRTFKKDKVLFELTPFSPLSKAQMKAIQEAGQLYCDFLGMSPEWS